MATGGSVRSKKTGWYKSRYFTPLHQAAMDGDLRKVEVLVRPAEDTGAQDGLGRTPIMWAVYNDHRSVVEYLVTVMSAGDLNVVDDYGLNVLHCIAGCTRPWSQLVECITDKSPNTLRTVDEYGNRPIDRARRHLPDNRQVYDTLGQLTQKQEQIQQQQQKQYLIGISTNVEHPCDITITVVGHQGVGKSCLVNQLKKEPFPKRGPGSTNTADFSVNYLGYNPDTGCRQKLDEDGEIQSERQRLKRIIDQRQQEEKADAENSKVDNKSTSEKSDKESRQIDENVTEIKTVTQSTEHVTENVPPSKEQRRVIEEGPPSTEQRHGIEEVLPSKEQRHVIEEVPPFTEQRRVIEEVLPSKEQRRDIEEVPPSTEQQRVIEEVLPSTEQRRDIEEVPPSTKQRRDIEEAPPSTEKRRVIEEVLPSPEQRHDTENVPPSKEQRRVIKEVMSTQMDGFDDKDLKGHITIYDFGGEKVFYNTHHCFMSSNMVFVLVFDVAMCLDPRRSKTGYEMIEFWLKAFATYAVDEVKDKGTPPVILVGSHLDQVSPKRKQEDLFQTVLDKLYEKPEIREIIETHVKEIFPVANLNDFTENKETYERMWNKIIEIAPFQSQWMKPIPARWVALEYELVRLKRKGEVILTYDDLLAMNHKLVVPLPEDDIMNFLRKLRFAGSFLCFDLHSRNPFIVLQPQWIIDAFKAIITDPKFTTDLSPKLRLQWKEYAKSGVLRYDVIQQLWGFSATYPFLEEEDKLFISMETLGLMTKPLSDDTEVDYFIVPSILQNADPELFRPILHDSGTVTTVTLCIKFDNQFIPQAIWDKMIASCIHRFQRPREFGNDDQTYVQDGLACLPQAIWDNMIANCFHWFHRPRWHGIDVHKYVQRGLACLRVDPMWNMIINCRDNTMKVTMFKKDTDNNVLPGTGINLLQILEFLLKQILELNQQSHLKYQFYLHNDFRFTANDELVKVEDLQHYERLQCHGSKGIDWIDRNDLHVWFKNPNPKAAPIHKGFQDILKELPDRKLSYKEFGRVSKYIGSTYQTFFVELDCPITLVEQEMEEHRHLTFRSRIAKIFIQLGNTKADIGFLAIADAMSRHGMDPKLLMDILDSNRDISFKDETLSEGWLNTDLSVIDAKIIADHVAVKAYFNLFLELGCTPSMVDEFDYQYRNKKPREQIIALLEAFIQETNPRPTVNAILLAMQECKMNTESLITALKKRQG